MAIFRFFKTAAAAILDCQMMEILTVGTLAASAILDFQIL